MRHSWRTHSFTPPVTPYPGHEQPIEIAFRWSARWGDQLPAFLLVDAWEWALACLCFPWLKDPSHLFVDGNGRGAGERIYIRVVEPYFGARLDLLRFLADLHAWHDYFAGIGPEPSLAAPPVRSENHDPCNLLPSNRKPRGEKERVQPGDIPPRKAVASPDIAHVRMRAVFLRVDPNEEAEREVRRRALEAQAWKAQLSRRGQP